MKNFDRINFIGRVVIGLYFLFSGVCLFISMGDRSFSALMTGFLGFMAFWCVVGGVLLIAGVKPRATAGVLAFILIILMGVDFVYLANSEGLNHHILEQYGPSSNNLAVSNWASQQIHLFLGKMAILGACLFIAGSRKIPHCIMVRSESNMQNKYGA